MRRALIAAALPTAFMALWFHLRPEYLPDAPKLLALCAATSLGLALLLHLIKRERA